MDHVRCAVLIITASAGLLAGCGDGEQTETTPSTGPLVTYERSGGIAGVSERLQVGQDGGAVLITGPDRERTTLTVAGDELERLRSELEAADFSDPDGPPGAGCADCFAYRIEYGDEAVDFIEIEEPAESLRPALDHLGDLVAAHSPPP
jgi:hypothetical protein